MAYQHTIETNYERIVNAVFAEESDNSVKQSAVLEVRGYVEDGARVYKVEDRERGVFAGVQVIKDDEILFSKFRKQEP